MLKEKFSEPNVDALDISEKMTPEQSGVNKVEKGDALFGKVSIDKHLINTMREFVEGKIPNIDTVDENVLKAIFISEFNKLIIETEQAKKEGAEIFASIKDDSRIAVFFEEMLKGVPIKSALEKAALQEYMPDDKDVDGDNISQNETSNENLKNRNKESFVEFVCENCDDENLINQFIDFVIELSNKILNKNLDKDIITALWRSFIFEREVKANFEKGTLEGRNQKIEKQLEARVSRDGICSPSSHGLSSKKTMGYIEKLLNN